MWICAWTLTMGGNEFEDFWSVHETEAEAEAYYLLHLKEDNLHCASVAKITQGTEPHWVEDKNNGT